MSEEVCRTRKACIKDARLKLSAVINDLQNIRVAGQMHEVDKMWLEMCKAVSKSMGLELDKYE